MALPGCKKNGGRNKGTPNKITRDLLDKLDELGFDPAEALVYVHNQAVKQYEKSEEVLALIRDAVQNPHDESKNVYIKKELRGRSAEFLKIVESSASHIMQYTHPKRKAIEHSLNPDSKPLGFQQVVLYVPDNGRAKKG